MEILGENLFLCKKLKPVFDGRFYRYLDIKRLLHRQLENNKQRKQFFFVDETAIVELNSIVQLESCTQSPS